jgi:hypothetical protein
MSYCKSLNRPEFNWREFLSRAQSEPVAITEAEHGEARKKAVNWAFCACGNQSEKIKRDEDGIPRDWTLLQMGMLFGTYIHSSDWEGALRILDKIEKYGAEIENI